MQSTDGSGPRKRIYVHAADGLLQLSVLGARRIWGAVGYPGRSRNAGRRCGAAGVLGIYLAALHLILYWPRFPWWYNLGVVIPAVPAVLFGGTLGRAARFSLTCGASGH